MDVTNKVTIPEDVVNAKEYLKWYALNKHPLLSNPLQTTSDGGVVNIAMLPHMLRKAIEHLAPKEQEDLLNLKKQWIALNSKRNVAKAMAYGHMGCLGGRKPEEARVLKMTPFEEDITELLGRMFTIPEVVKILGEDNGVIIVEDDVKKVLKKNIVEIERKREEYRNRITDVRLYNKRPRLDELGWMYSKMKARYISFNSIDAYNCMLRTLEQIRKEAEGDVLNINGVLDINIEAQIQNQVQKEILKTINIKEIILGRVAARMNYDLAKLIAGLHNSYYAKFVGISGKLEQDAEMEYPSTMNYDFAAIERQAGTEVEDIKAEDVTEEEKSSAQRTKEMFLSKIRKQREDLEKRNMSFDAEAEIYKDKVSEEVYEPVERGKGRAKDKIPPSKQKKNSSRVNKRDYYTGEKK